MSVVPGCTEKRHGDELSEEVKQKRCQMMKPETAENSVRMPPLSNLVFNENLEVPTGWELEPILHFKENNKLS